MISAMIFCSTLGGGRGAKRDVGLKEADTDAVLGVRCIAAGVRAVAGFVTWRRKGLCMLDLVKRHLH